MDARLTPDDYNFTGPIILLSSSLNMEIPMRAILIALSTALAAQVAAHSGGLNKQGCHTLARNHTIATERKKLSPVHPQIRQY